MKIKVKIIMALGASCFLFLGLACTQKSIPVITSRTSEPIKKEKKSVDMQPDLVIGKAIFENRCKNCHDLPLVNQFTAQRWDGILSYMIPRARLTDKQGIHVTAYVKAKASK